MPKTIFVNLPVVDVAKATAFYSALGFEKNPQFSNEAASSMVWSDTITVMLLGHAFFQGFTPKPIADARATTEVLLCLSCDSREQVDNLADKAAASGGRADVRAKQDLPFMYGRSFEDPDGHIYELVWMNPDASFPGH